MKNINYKLFLLVALACPSFAQAEVSVIPDALYFEADETPVGGEFFSIQLARQTSDEEAKAWELQYTYKSSPADAPAQQLYSLNGGCEFTPIAIICKRNIDDKNYDVIRIEEAGAMVGPRYSLVFVDSFSDNQLTSRRQLGRGMTRVLPADRASDVLSHGISMTDGTVERAWLGTYQLEGTAQTHCPPAIAITKQDTSGLKVQKIPINTAEPVRLMHHFFDVGTPFNPFEVAYFEPATLHLDFNGFKPATRDDYDLEVVSYISTTRMFNAAHYIDDYLKSIMWTRLVEVEKTATDKIALRVNMFESNSTGNVLTNTKMLSCSYIFHKNQ